MILMSVLCFGCQKDFSFNLLLQEDKSPFGYFCLDCYMENIFGENYSTVVTSEEDDYNKKGDVDIGDEYP